VRRLLARRAAVLDLAPPLPGLRQADAVSGSDEPYAARVAGLEERAAALRMPRELRDRLLSVSPGARFSYVVGMLICDARGHILKADLARALRDPKVLDTAERLAAEWELT